MKFTLPSRFTKKQVSLFLLTLSLLGLLFSFAGIASAIFVNAQAMLRTRTAIAQAYGKARLLQSVLSGLKETEIGQSGFLLTGKPEFLKAYKTGVSEVSAALRLLRRLTQDPNEITPSIDRKMAELERTVALALSERHAQALEVMHSDLDLELSEQVNVRAATEARRLQNVAEKASSDNRRVVEDLKEAVVFSSIAAALLILVALYLILNQYRRWSGEARQMRENESLLEERVVERTEALMMEVEHRRLAETALLQVQARLDLAASFSGVASWTWDAVNGHILWSGPVEKVFGLSAQQLDNYESFTSHIEPHDRSRIKSLIQWSLNTGADYDSEFRFMLPDGSTRWIAGRGGVVYENSRVVRMSGVNFDITARKESELKVRASEKLLQEREHQIDVVFERAAIGDWSWNMAEDCLRCHPTVWKQYGSPPIPAGRPASWFQSRQHPDDWLHIAHAMQTALEGSTKLDVEFRVIWPDGSVHWLACRGTVERDESGNPIQTHGINIEITERKQIEMQLRESEAQFRDLANAMPQLVWQARPDGSICFFNNRWSELTGRLPELGAVKSWEPILHPDDLQTYLQTWSASVQSGMPFEMELRLRSRQTDQYRWYLGRALPTRDQAGTILRWFGTTTDVHEQKTAKDSLEVEVFARTEELRQTLRQKDILFKEVHHRVKNNLQVISSLLKMQAETVEGTEAAVALQESRDRVFSMALIHERLYSNRQIDQLDFVAYAQTLVDELVFSYAQPRGVTARLRACAISLEVDQAIPCGLILNELVTNALKYAYPQGQGEIRIELTESSDYVVTLAVSDSGVGLRSTFKHSESKTLGITIVDILARQLGGSLHVKSEHGATFSVTFPRQPQPFALESAA